ncbi:MAG: SDR family oxidoreductase [Burkholderiales bacterium]|nr:SDR family oxidoreductase [Burkholderiales bacterium]
MRTLLLTHAKHYVGPGALPVLLREGMQVLCHDESFADTEAARAFEANFPGAVALRAQSPEGLIDELQQKKLAIDTLISNDVFPNSPHPIEELDVNTLRSSFEALLVFPFRLTQLLLPKMKERKHGSFVFVTSARYLQPESGYSIATSIRAGTTAFALALAKETASCGIQVNVFAPNYLYSEAYYPRARFVDDAAGRELIASKVPMGRLGDPKEAGEVIAFLASGRAPFMTGQVINFTGGWP